MRDLLVYPPMSTVEGKSVQIVIGDIYIDTPGATSPYEPFTFYADIPFTYKSQQTEVVGTVIQFLSGVKRSGGPVPFRYAWWLSRWFNYSALLGGSVLVFGVLLPLAANSMKVLWAEIRASKPGQEEEMVTEGAVLGDESSVTPSSEEPAPEEPATVKELEGEPLPEVERESEALKKYQGEFYPVVRAAESEKDKEEST
jgi:hypothetical protein